MLRNISVDMNAVVGVFIDYKYSQFYSSNVISLTYIHIQCSISNKNTKLLSIIKNFVVRIQLNLHYPHKYRFHQLLPKNDINH